MKSNKAYYELKNKNKDLAKRCKQLEAVINKITRDTYSPGAECGGCKHLFSRINFAGYPYYYCKKNNKCNDFEEANNENKT